MPCSHIHWMTAPPPNYINNTDRRYPYSEMPSLATCDLVKIPLEPDEHIDHVDYWGEGRIDTPHGFSGFPNSYNVNQTYQLVSHGPDKGKKIPNRIPVISFDECNTSAYIKDNSVITVTTIDYQINQSCARDIARIINKDIGKVIVLGSEFAWQKIESLNCELALKSLYYCPDYDLPTDMQVSRQFNSHHFAFLSVPLIIEELKKRVNTDNYDKAIDLIKRLDNPKSSKVISVIMMDLLRTKANGNFKVMSFLYKLWSDAGKDMIKKHVPKAIKYILDSDNVIIVNYEYELAIKLDMNLDSDHDRLAWGHNGDKTSKRVCWRFIPVWENNELIFKLYNVDCDMYLKLEVHADKIGDRMAYGAKVSNLERQKYYVEPCICKNGDLVFCLINKQYGQGLKLAVTEDTIGDRLLWGHNGNIYENKNRYKWCVSLW